MGDYGVGAGMMGGGLGGFSLFFLLTWLFLDVFLVLGIMYFWKELKKKK